MKKKDKVARKLKDHFLAEDISVALENIRAAVNNQSVHDQHQSSHSGEWSGSGTYKMGSLPKMICHMYSIILEVTSSDRSLFNTQLYMR